MEKLHISVGANRFEKSWRNKEATWEALVAKFKEPTRTHETAAQYAILAKKKRANIKDVGGFVGGYIQGGGRHPQNIKYRTLITLDVDFAKDLSMLDTIELVYGCTAAMYTTHAHKASKPRFRVVIPLARKVSPDEYQAISRKIAETLGISFFDDTTYQPERLMYWPSASKDGPYECKVTEGGYLNPDEVLDAYEDWTDCTSWPVSDRVDKLIRKSTKKQGDPCEKPGLVGLFCREYSITKVIEEFLSDVYKPTKGSRYTYQDGTSEAGLVIYENKFAFSHHSTDPCSMKLCNAFDLVRIHKFGDKDDDVSPDLPLNRYPSSVAMTKFCEGLSGVKKRIAHEAITSAQKDFGTLELVKPSDEEEEQEDIDTGWADSLLVDKRGRYLSTIDNAVKILIYDPNLRGSFAYNELSKNITKVDGGKSVEEVDDANIRHYLEATYKITGISKIADATLIVAKQNSYQPVRDYLNSVKGTWDGTERLDTLFVDYLGAEDSEYTRAITRKALVACVARTYNPGVKFDNMLTLIGKQGIGKSTILRILGRSWFTDSFSTVIGKEAVEQILGFWIVEVAELAGLRRAEVEQTKHFISKQKDTFRQAYARRTETHERQCVFFGTTNSVEFLTDMENRRYWTLMTYVQFPRHSVFTELEPVVDQVWAEAVYRYNNGESLILDKATAVIARERQDHHRKIDARVGLILEFLNTRLPEDYYERDLFDRAKYIAERGDDMAEPDGPVEREFISVAEIWTEYFGGGKQGLDRRRSNDITTLMAEILDWEKSTRVLRVPGYGPQKVYIRKKVEDEQHEQE